MAARHHGTPVTMDGYRIYGPGEQMAVEHGWATTELAGPPAGWLEFASFLDQVKSGHHPQVATVARVLLAEVIAR